MRRDFPAIPTFIGGDGASAPGPVGGLDLDELAVRVTSYHSAGTGRIAEVDFVAESAEQWDARDADYTAGWSVQRVGPLVYAWRLII